MKFQRMKDVCLGATVAALVMGAAPAAYAKVANMDIPVMFNNIKIVVDGKELKTDKLCRPLARACEYGKLPVVKYLIEEQNVKFDTKTMMVILLYTLQPLIQIILKLSII